MQIATYQHVLLTFVNKPLWLEEKKECSNQTKKNSEREENQNQVPAGLQGVYTGQSLVSTSQTQSANSVLYEQALKINSGMVSWLFFYPRFFAWIGSSSSSSSWNGLDDNFCMNFLFYCQTTVFSLFIHNLIMLVATR